MTEKIDIINEIRHIPKKGKYDDLFRFDKHDPYATPRMHDAYREFDHRVSQCGNYTYYSWIDPQGNINQGIRQNVRYNEFYNDDDELKQLYEYKIERIKKFNYFKNTDDTEKPKFKLVLTWPQVQGTTVEELRGEMTCLPRSELEAGYAFYHDLWCFENDCERNRVRAEAFWEELQASRRGERWMDSAIAIANSANNQKGGFRGTA